MPYKDNEDQRAYGRQHYIDNKPLYRGRAKVSRKKAILRNREFVNETKAKPCTDCGLIFPPECMDYDHISDNKDKTIARLVNNGVSINRILKEIEKCELVCSNCHRIRTKARLNAGLV